MYEMLTVRASGLAFVPVAPEPRNRPSMRIGMLSQWCQPETGGAQLVGVYAREFVKQGHQVRVLTGFPNYPDGVLYPGYKMRPRMREWDGDVRIDRVALYPNHNSSAVGRVLNYSSFGLSAATLGAGAMRGVEAVWVFNHPITVSLPLLAHTRMGRVPYFLHVQDLWPDSLLGSGMLPPGWAVDRVASVISAIVRLTENRAAVIGVISPSVRDLILERNPRLDPAKIVYAPNPANEAVFRPVNLIRETVGAGNDPGIVEMMYAGAIGEVQGLDTLLDAANILRNRSDILFTLVGDGVSKDRLERKAAELGLKNVRFLGRVTQEEIPYLIARADVQLVSLASSPFLAYTTPSKIPSLLASAVPIVAQLQGDGAKLVRDSGGGLVVSPGNAEGLADAIQHLADVGQQARDQMGCAGRRYYEENLSSRSASARISDALQDSVKAA